MPTDPDLLGSLPALKRAAQRALELAIATNTPCIVMRDGQIVDIAGEHRAPMQNQHRALLTGRDDIATSGQYGEAGTYTSRITWSPQQCGGKPSIRGMRIRVSDVLEMLADGVSEAEILADFPDLEPEDIRACLDFAAKRVAP